MKQEEKDYLIRQINNPDINSIEDINDGYHTFNSLYNQRLYLFAALVKAYKELAWKTTYHEDGEQCFGGDWFLVGIDTPEGSYTYHYELKYWDLFDCIEISKAKPFDGHTDKDVNRLMSLNNYWHDCNENSEPLDDYKGYDWVLVQFIEKETGFELIPTVAEFRDNRWWLESSEKNNIDYYKHLQAVCWKPL